MKVSADLSVSTLILSLAVFSLLLSPSKIFFIFVTMIFISSILRVSISVYVTHLFLHAVHFFHENDEYIIISTLNALCDGSTISSPSESDACFLSLQTVVFFCISLPLMSYSMPRGWQVDVSDWRN